MNNNLLYYIKLANRISRLNNDALQEITNLEGNNLEEYIGYLKKEPVARNCCDIKALMAANRMKDYVHDDPRIQDFVRDMLANMDVSFPRIVGQMSSSMPLGFAVAETCFGIKKNKLVVTSIDVLDQRMISFEGKRGIIQKVIYRDTKKIEIPYWKCIHVTRGYSADFDDPFGVPEMKAALHYIKAKHSFLYNMIAASKYFTTGIVYARVDSSKPVEQKLEDGRSKRVSKGEYISEQLKNLSNTGAVVTDKTDEIGSLQLSDGSHFWEMALARFDKYIKSAFNVSEAMVDGVMQIPQTATAINSMFSVTDSSIYAYMQQLQSELINKVLKPVINSNFGVQKNYGRFEMEPVNPEKANITFQSLLSAAGYGLVDTNSIDVKNKVREHLGLGKIDEESEFRRILQQTQMQSLINSMAGQDQEMPTQDMSQEILE